MAGQQLDFTAELGRGAFAIAGGTLMGSYAALMTAGYKPALVGASLSAMLNLAVGAHVCTIGRHCRTLAFVNVCASVVTLIIAMANGVEINPEHIKKMYDICCSALRF